MDPEYIHAVRIHADARIGSGLLYFPTVGTHFYVLTAEHVIYGEKVSSEAPPRSLSLQKIRHPALAADHYELPSTTRILRSTNLEHDLAVLVLEKVAFNVTGSPSNPPAVQSNYGLETCWFAGFPNYADWEIRRERGNIEGNPRATPDRFLVRALYSLSDNYTDSAHNVGGESGAGLFLHHDSRSYLLGVITDYAKLDSFYGTGLSTVNDLLSSSGLATIPTVELVVNANLKAIHQNNRAIGARILTNIGTVHVTRAALKESVQPFKSNSVFIVHGNAGAGKSAFARDLVAELGDEHELLLFTGEQIARDTLDQVLSQLPAPILGSIDDLLSNTALRKKKVFWIESAEKLIETKQLGAIIELLNRVKANPHLKLLVTIRSYMVDLFQLSLAVELPRNAGIIPLGDFTDEELKVVETAYPDLKTLLSRNKINNLLHIPFYLTYAVRLLHILKEEDDLTEAKFREIIWKEVIENGKRERGQVFEALAVKRAKEMSLYTQVEAPPGVIDSLNTDHLIAVEDDELKDRYCPAHDILEDWALMRYVFRHKRSSGSAEVFFLSIGNELPIRRAFRLWMGEALQAPAKETMVFIKDTISNSAIADHWKDELYISILRSEYSENFISENSELLLRDNQRLAYRFINMLKTACKETRKGQGVTPLTDLIGAGWGSMVRFLYANRSLFDRNPYAVMSFLMEWGNKIDNGTPIDPREGKAAGLLGQHLLGQGAVKPGGKFTASAGASGIDKLIKLVFDLARFIPEEVLALLTTARGYPRTERTLTDYKVREYYDKILLLAISGTHCRELCKHFPDLIIQLFDHMVRPRNLTELQRHDQWGHRFEHKTEFDFGLKYNYEYRCSPASALQTPAYWLLSAHSAKALRYIVGLLNYGLDVYKASETGGGDRIVEVELTLDDGTIVIQTGSPLLWGAYRGSNGYTPSVLQSILMALEKWLFDVAGCADDVEHNKIRRIYRFLYHASRSVCPTAVMASVALKFPTEIGDIAVPMFSSKDILLWDASRSYGEFPDSLFKNWGTKTVHEIDREESNALPHRRFRNGLGRLMFYLQGQSEAMSLRIWPILDKFLADPATAEQAGWQKLLTEMDIRKYKVEPVAGKPGMAALTPEYEGLAKEIVDQGQRELERTGPETAYHSWIEQTIDSGHADAAQFSYFREVLSYYREGKFFERLFARPGTLAVIGLRDYFSELNQEERVWCIETIFIFLQHLIRDRENPDHDWDLRKHNLADIDPVLYFFPSLIILSKQMREKELQLKTFFCHLILAPLHANELSKLFHAVRKDLWRGDYEFAYQCFIFLLAYGAMADEKFGWRTGYGQLDSNKKSVDVDALIQDVMKDVHSINLTIQLDSYRSRFYSKAIAFVPANQDIGSFRQFVQYVLELHLESFGSGNRRGEASEYFEDRQVMTEFIPRVLLAQPLEFGITIVEDLYKRYKADDRFPRRWTDRSDKDKFIESLIEGLIRAIDSSQGCPEEGMRVAAFWAYWRQIDGLNQASGMQHFATELLLDLKWKEDAMQWIPLEGHAEYMKELIGRYGPGDLPLVINLLASIGDKTLMPQGISLLVALYKSNSLSPTDLLADSKIRLIQRAYYQHGRRIRGNKKLLDDFIFLLDRLIELGSSEAYWIREDMITYKVG